MDEEVLLEAEAEFDARFGPTGWRVDGYLSPSEKAINKPILPTTSEVTGRMGHPRNWPGPDTPLIEAAFMDSKLRWHTLTFTTVEDAVMWLDRNDPFNENVVL